MGTLFHFAVGLAACVVSGVVLAEPLATTKPSTRPAGLIAHYPLAGDARDASGQGHDGRVRGAKPTEDHLGRKNAALAFDGMDNEVVLDPPPALSARGFTVSVWVRADLGEGAKPWVDVTDGNGKFRDPIVGQDDGFTIRTFQLWLNTERLVVWHRLGEYSSAWTKKPVIEAGKWFHVAATFDGSFHHLYIDAREEHKVEGIFTVCHCTPIYIGSKGTGTLKRAFFSGAMSDLRFYDRALSAEEIAGVRDEKP